MTPGATTTGATSPGTTSPGATTTGTTTTGTPPDTTPDTPPEATPEATPTGPAALDPALTDATLTRDGLASRGAGRVLVIGCGALAREILAVLEANHLTHVDLSCLPAILHNTPDRIVPALEEALDKHRGAYESIFIAYADCGTGGALAALCAREGIEMIEGPHCYSFFDGNEAFAERAEVTSFFLTDFLTRQFDAFVVKPLGLDRYPDLTEMYFGNYEKLVYLAQTDDPALDAKARAAAERLGLAYERRSTGYGDLVPALAGL